MTTKTVRKPDPDKACKLHRAYEADYCPVCGTARKIGAYA